MKLYTTPGGQWAGTEAAWKAAMKAEGVDIKTYTGRKQIEVPTSKPELLEFLTFYRVNVIGAQMQPATDAAASDPPKLAAAPDLEALRALHNPEGVASAAVPAVEVPATTMSQIVTNASGQVINLDEIFTAAPIPKQVELAVGLLDRLEAAVR